MPSTAPPDFATNAVCPRCGAGLACAMLPSDGPRQTKCWCTQLPPILQVPAPNPAADATAPAAAACYCPTCLQDIVHEQQLALARSLSAARH